MLQISKNEGKAIVFQFVVSRSWTAFGTHFWWSGGGSQIFRAQAECVAVHSWRFWIGEERKKLHYRKRKQNAIYQAVSVNLSSKMEEDLEIILFSDSYLMTFWETNVVPRLYHTSRYFFTWAIMSLKFEHW